MKQYCRILPNAVCRISELDWKREFRRYACAGHSEPVSVLTYEPSPTGK